MRFSTQVLGDRDRANNGVARARFLAKKDETRIQRT